MLSSDSSLGFTGYGDAVRAVRLPPRSESGQQVLPSRVPGHVRPRTRRVVRVPAQRPLLPGNARGESTPCPAVPVGVRRIGQSVPRAPVRLLHEHQPNLDALLLRYAQPHPGLLLPVFPLENQSSDISTYKSTKKIIGLADNVTSQAEYDVVTASNSTNLSFYIDACELLGGEEAILRSCLEYPPPSDGNSCFFCSKNYPHLSETESKQWSEECEVPPAANQVVLGSVAMNLCTEDGECLWEFDNFLVGFYGASTAVWTLACLVGMVHMYYAPQGAVVPLHYKLLSVPLTQLGYSALSFATKFTAGYFASPKFNLLAIVTLVAQAVALAVSAEVALFVAAGWDHTGKFGSDRCDPDSLCGCGMGSGFRDAEAAGGGQHRYRSHLGHLVVLHPLFDPLLRQCEPKDAATALPDRRAGQHRHVAGHVEGDALPPLQATPEGLYLLLHGGFAHWVGQPLAHLGVDFSARPRGPYLPILRGLGIHLQVSTIPLQ